MKRAIIAGIAGACFVLAATAAEDNSAPKDSTVLVEGSAPRNGSIADVIAAYGTAVQATNGGMTLSMPAEGRVMRILVTAGESVRAGQSVLEFHLSAAASSAQAQATSALKLAREEQTRTNRLLGQQLATRDQKAQADKAASDAQATLDALERETGGKAQQVLRAPFDGVIATTPVAQGDRVAAGAALATITRSKGLVVTVGIEPSDLKRVMVDQPVDVEPMSGVEAAIKGRVARIDRSLNPKTRLVDADIALNDDVLQGESFRAQIEVGQLKGWVVPREAVLDDEEGSFVFQIAGDKAKRVKVKLVGSNKQESVVSGPLDPKLDVVSAGNYQLEDGMSVREKEDSPGDGKDASEKDEGATSSAPQKKAEKKP